MTAGGWGQCCGKIPAAPALPTGNSLMGQVLPDRWAVKGRALLGAKPPDAHKQRQSELMSRTNNQTGHIRLPSTWTNKSTGCEHKHSCISNAIGEMLKWWVFYWRAGHLLQNSSVMEKISIITRIFPPNYQILCLFVC